MLNLNDSFIYEKIDPKKYKKQTFSGYKKTQVFSELKKCILKQNITVCKPFKSALFYWFINPKPLSVFWYKLM